LQIGPDDPIADREALETLAEHCGRFSPIVAVEDSPRPDSLLLDITGVARLFGGETAMAEEIINDFTRRGLMTHIAIADTPGAAWAVAHWTPSLMRRESDTECSTSTNTAAKGRDCKLKIENCKLQIDELGYQFPTPNHQSPIANSSIFVIVPPGGSSAALHPLPIEALRLGEKTLDLLHQLGIRRIGQLELLPRRELSSRFGPRLLKRMDQASGRLAEPLRARQPLPEFAADFSSEYPISHRENIEAVLEELIAQVAGKLAGCNRGAARLECRLELLSGDVFPVSFGLFEPTASQQHLLGLMQLQFERLRLPGPVTTIHVAATATAPLEHPQQEMFAGDSARQNPRHLAGLVDRLSSRLGRRAVLGVRLCHDAQPELAWRGDPLVGDTRRRRLRKIAPTEMPPRPLRLLPRPIRLAATSIMPDGPPLRFHLGGREHRVAHTWGPERIETGWWRGRTIGRDYYRVETATGRRFWLFRRLRDGQWFVQGMF